MEPLGKLSIFFGMRYFSKTGSANQQKQIRNDAFQEKTKNENRPKKR